jgi:hypothetical protein
MFRETYIILKILTCNKIFISVVLGCTIPHELDAIKWKATGRRRKRRRRSHGA